MLKIEKAQEIANNVGLDLVEISPNSNPPVCKILDYGKFLYEIEKQVWHQASNSQTVNAHILEIQKGTECVEEDIERR